MEQKILLNKNIGKEEPDMSEQVVSGPVCPLPNAKGGAVYKGGALTSAFMSAFL